MRQVERDLLGAEALVEGCGQLERILVITTRGRLDGQLYVLSSGNLWPLNRLEDTVPEVASTVAFTALPPF